MKVTEARARGLLRALGFRNADTYTGKVLRARMGAVEKDVTQEVRDGLKDPGLAGLLRSLTAANRRGEPVEIVWGAKAEEEEIPPTGNAFLDETAPPAEEEIIGEDSGDAVVSRRKGIERKRAARAKVIAKMAPEFGATTVRQPHKPGVCRSIYEILSAGCRTKPVTRDDILRGLAKRFPDRSLAGMASTVNTFPQWIELHYPYRLHKRGKGYWLEKI